MMVIENEFEIGDIVFVKVDEEQRPRIVTGIKIYPNLLLSYEVSDKSGNLHYFAFELTTAKNVLL